jgi:flagellar basal-body rod modification protein FlgD
MISALAGPGAGAGVATAAGRASLSRDEFLKILVTELTSQDPLEPMDNSEFVQQLVGLQTLEQTAALTDGLRSFESFMQMSSASSMIGRTVRGRLPSGAAVEGVVSSVSLEGGQVNLTVGQYRLPLGSITEIRPSQD